MRKLSAKRVIAAVLLMLPWAARLAAQTRADTTGLRWQPAPVLPPGAMLAVVSGDPTAPGRSIIQLSIPDGYRIPPHSHPNAEHVEVKQGVLLLGMGDRIDEKKTFRAVVGDTGTAPAGMHHWSIAKGPTVLFVTFEGPYTITYVHAYDVPRQTGFPNGY